MYLTKIIKDWYRGKLIKGKCISNIKDGLPTQGNLPLLEVVLDRYEQPLLAKILKHVGRYCEKNYKWLIATTIAFAALIFALF